MTNDLKQLLNDSAAHAPAEPHSVSDIVRSAQRSHRVHTAKLVGGSALALALVVGVGYAAITGNGSDDAQPAKLEHGEVKTIDKGDLEDARQLVPGKDYDVLAELLAVGGNRERVGAADGSWEPDDLSIFWKDGEIVSVNGEDGAETPLGPYPGQPFTVLAAGDDHLVRGEVFRDPYLLVDDLSSGEEHKLPASVKGIDDFSAVEVRDVSIYSGRIWATVPADGSESDSQARVVVSAPLDGGDGFRREVDAPVSRAMVGDGTLAWVDDEGKFLMVRDLESGDETEVVRRSAADCWLTVADVSADRVAESQWCGDEDHPTPTTTVWSLDGGPTIDLGALRLTRGALSEQMMVFRDSQARDVQTYVYRFEAGEVLNLGSVAGTEDERNVFWPAKAAGDRLLFPSPNRKDHLALIALK